MGCSSVLCQACSCQPGQTPSTYQVGVGYWLQLCIVPGMQLDRVTAEDTINTPSEYRV